MTAVLPKEPTFRFLQRQERLAVAAAGRSVIAHATQLVQLKAEFNFMTINDPRYSGYGPRPRGADCSLTHLKLIVPPPSAPASDRCSICGAPFEAMCPYCGRVGTGTEAEALDGQLRIFCDGGFSTEFTLWSLMGDGLKLDKAPIPLAENDRLELMETGSSKIDLRLVLSFITARRVR